MRTVCDAQQHTRRPNLIKKTVVVAGICYRKKYMLLKKKKIYKHTLICGRIVRNKVHNILHSFTCQFLDVIF